MISLEGKVALVTGSAKGLGRAVIKALAQSGVICAIHYLQSKKEAQTLLEEIHSVSPRSIVVQGSVAEPKSAERIVSEVVNAYGTLDILMNNVGNFVVKPLELWTDEDFTDVHESNLMSVWYMTRAALPHMRKHEWGRIVNVGCVGCEQLTIRKNTTPYYIAKHGVVALTKHWATYETCKDITYNAILPGVLENAVAYPDGVSPEQIVPLTEAAEAVMKLVQDTKSGLLVPVNRGWLP